MKKYFLIGTMILCSMIWAISAKASPITLEEVGVVPMQAINVTLLYDNGTTFYNGGAWVGSYQVRINGGGIINAYCIDYLHFNPSGVVSYDLIDLASGSKYDLLEYERAAWIMANYPAESGDLNQLVNAQLAIWEILSPDAGSLSSGNVSALSWSGNGSLAGAQAIVNLALEINDFDTSGFKLAYNANSQDYVLPPVSVPEPTSILLLGFGLIGVAVLRRRLKG